nr:tetratricopeptide repeat protein [uncultured Methanospirillum sp.]
MNSDPNSLFREGKKVWHTGNLQQAADLFFDVLEVDDQYHLAWNALGVVYSQAGEFEDADTCFKNALLLAPDNPVYLQNRGRNNRKLKILWELKSENVKKPAKISCMYYIVGIAVLALIVGVTLFFQMIH